MKPSGLSRARVVNHSFVLLRVRSSADLQGPFLKRKLLLPIRSYCEVRQMAQDAHWTYQNKHKLLAPTHGDVDAGHKPTSSVGASSPSEAQSGVGAVDGRLIVEQMAVRMEWKVRRSPLALSRCPAEIYWLLTEA
jgi:hypothetical protein